MEKNAGSVRVLVVEDERHISRMLEFVLVKNGYEVRVANYGATALTLIREFRPEAVILDLVLPDITGTEILTNIRSHAETSDTAVIVQSAHTFEIDLPAAESHQRTVYCPKPIAPSHLLMRLKEFGLAPQGQAAARL